MSVAKGWSLVSVAIYGALAGVVAIVMGIRIGMLELTASPSLTCAGFVMTGLAGVAVLAVVLAPALHTRLLKLVAELLMIASAGLWGLTTAMSYWAHLARFSSL
jgi:uncharacterized membrane protein